MYTALHDVHFLAVGASALTLVSFVTVLESTSYLLCTIRDVLVQSRIHARVSRSLTMKEIFVRKLALIAAVSIAFTAAASNAMPFFETNSDPANHLIGVAATALTNSEHFLAFRFQISSPTQLESIGGNIVDVDLPEMFPAGNGLMFGAVVSLSGPSDTPNSFDLSTSDVLGTTLISAPASLNTTGGNISLSLSSGWYALVFGSGLFGATAENAGLGLLPQSTGSPDPGIFFEANSNGGSFSWTSDVLGADRFYVFASTTPIPEPNTALLLSLGLIGLTATKRKRLN